MADRIEVTLIDADMERLQEGEVLRLPRKDGYGEVSIRMMRQDEFDSGNGQAAYQDPSVDLVIDPHDLWDVSLDGRLTLRYRETPITIRAEQQDMFDIKRYRFAPPLASTGKKRK